MVFCVHRIRPHLQICESWVAAGGKWMKSTLWSNIPFILFYPLSPQLCETSESCEGLTRRWSAQRVRWHWCPLGYITYLPADVMDISLVKLQHPAGGLRYVSHSVNWTLLSVIFIAVINTHQSAVTSLTYWVSQIWRLTWCRFLQLLLLKLFSASLSWDTLQSPITPGGIKGESMFSPDLWCVQVHLTCLMMQSRSQGSWTNIPPLAVDITPL